MDGRRRDVVSYLTRLVAIAEPCESDRLDAAFRQARRGWCRVRFSTRRAAARLCLLPDGDDTTANGRPAATDVADAAGVFSSLDPIVSTDRTVRSCPS
jgi:hypothetical protein